METWSNSVGLSPMLPRASARFGGLRLRISLNCFISRVTLRYSSRKKTSRRPETRRRHKESASAAGRPFAFDVPISGIGALCLPLLLMLVDLRRTSALPLSSLLHHHGPHISAHMRLCRTNLRLRRSRVRSFVVLLQSRVDGLTGLRTRRPSRDAARAGGLVVLAALP